MSIHKRDRSSLHGDGPIKAFNGRYRFLSNFHNSPFTIAHVSYPTGEHRYQACKTLDSTEFRFIVQAATPQKARALGRRCTLRPDWELVKDRVMAEAVVAKFKQNPDLMERLLATGERTLIEGNWWGDTYWGVCNGIGQNRLGKLLMALRQGIRDEREGRKSSAPAALAPWYHEELAAVKRAMRIDENRYGKKEDGANEDPTAKPRPDPAADV